MTKQIPAIPSKKRLTWFLGVVFSVLLIMAFVGRGTIRTTLLPGAAYALHGRGLNKALQQERAQLQETYPFGQIRYISETPASCSLAYAEKLHTEVWCNASLFRGQVSIKNIAMEDFKAKAQTFEQSLKQQGWEQTANYTKIPSTEHLFGWWYSVQYQKKTGGNTCRLTVDRDNDPNLLDTYLNCDRTVLVL